MAQGLADTKARYDAACKRVLSDESGTVIHGLDTEDKSIHEGTVTYDIRFRAIVPDSEAETG